MWPAGSPMSSLTCNVIIVLSRDCPQAIYNGTIVNELVMYQSIPTAIIPPGQPPGFDQSSHKIDRRLHAKNL